MPYVEAKDGTQIFYKDWGQGKPIVFHHGWPLSSDDWDTQMLFLYSEDTELSASIAVAMGVQPRFRTATIWITTLQTPPQL